MASKFSSVSCPSTQWHYFVMVSFLCCFLSWIAGLLLELLPLAWWMRTKAGRWRSCAEGTDPSSGSWCFWKSCSTVSLCVFIVEDHLFQVFEVCLPFGENAFQIVDLVLNVCFLGPFFLRVCESDLALALQQFQKDWRCCGTPGIQG
ncbi:uncharacterized protein LOC119589443 [Penaeus monodon]|uniref:uncharacterized protein LOC119589443 n=1 Tax=Penaeus monodon TaxID=6687 RepID=UPI0018A7317A|nr:uncharacterized protein LOC119589443 [Penaeus monodon]